MIITKPIGSPNHSIRQPVETLGYDNTRDHETDRPGSRGGVRGVADG